MRPSRLLLPIAAAAMLAGCVTVPYGYRDGNGDYYYGQGQRVRPTAGYVVPGGVYGGVGYGYPGGAYGSVGYGYPGGYGGSYYGQYGGGYYGSPYYGGGYGYYPPPRVIIVRPNDGYPDNSTPRPPRQERPQLDVPPWRNPGGVVAPPQEPRRAVIMGGDDGPRSMASPRVGGFGEMVRRASAEEGGRRPAGSETP